MWTSSLRNKWKACRLKFIHKVVRIGQVLTEVFCEMVTDGYRPTLCLPCACTRGGNCSPGSSRFIVRSFRRLKKPRSWEMSARSYALYSVCHFPFFLIERRHEPTQYSAHSHFKLYSVLQRPQSTNS